MWKRSTKCDGGHCLEMEQEGPLVFLRNNIDPNRQIVATQEEWEAFIKGVKAGDFD